MGHTIIDDLRREKYDADNFQVGHQKIVESSGTFGELEITYQVVEDEKGRNYWKTMSSRRTADSR